MWSALLALASSSECLDWSQALKASTVPSGWSLAFIRITSVRSFLFLFGSVKTMSAQFGDLVVVKSRKNELGGGGEVKRSL